jgi:hypothetical protein
VTFSNTSAPDVQRAREALWRDLGTYLLRADQDAALARFEAAIRADEQQRVHDQIVGLEDRIIAEVEARYAATVA